MGVQKMVGGTADALQMDKVQAAVVAALAPFRDNTEAIVLAGALLRLVRMFIRLYRSDLRAGFRDASIAYLRGEKELPETSANDLRALGFKAPDSVN